MRRQPIEERKRQLAKLLRGAPSGAFGFLTLSQDAEEDWS
jgi:hypothetical protein